LKLVRGEYDEDWSPGPFNGTVWKGDFVIELADEAGNTITETNLKPIYPDEPLIFTSRFKFEFDDYNDDGDADFTIGQYASSNGKVYKIYTVRSNGEIEELPIRGQPSLFISQNSSYSTRLEKVDSVSFKTSYYDNSAQKQVEKIFRWDGKAFVQVDSRETKR
jgi:bla regulator protein BlaR1